MDLLSVIVLLGGIALFLYGMSLMGDGLKKAAGNRLELILYRLTDTPVKGIGLGAGVTAVIQSSAATSVMAVGFVNSAMMQLRQAISVIMGAVIGTSVTGWVICLSEMGSGASAAFKLLSTESLSALVALAGMLLKMVSKKKSLHHVADIMMGFAILMFGLKTMSSSMEALQDNPAFLSALTRFENPLLGILAGMLFTALLQSASASVGILQALSVTGVITFSEALPIILGVAIGASVPVLMAGIGSSPNGKRTALSYPIIEVSRVVLFAAVFYALNAAFRFPLMERVMSPFSIALLNTLFRLSTVALLFPAIPLIEKAVTRLIPADPEDEKENQDMNRLEERFIAYPILAVEQTRLTIGNMAELSRRSIFEAIGLLDEYTEKGAQNVQRMEDTIDRYEDKIGSYLMRLTGHEMADAQNKAVSQYLRAITDLERISDHALNISERAAEIREKQIRFSDKGAKEMKNLIAAVTEIVNLAMDSFLNDDENLACRVEPLEQVIDRICLSMREKHTARLQKGKCTIANGYVFNDLISDFERVSDHCSNIGIVIVELKQNALDVHELSGAMKEEHTNHFEEYFGEYSARYLKKKDEAQA